MTTESKTLRRAAWMTGVSLLTTGVVQAQDVDPRVAPIAQKLYDDGVALMDAKNFAEACPKLEQVTKLVPNGIGGHEALGDCYVGQKRFASAWGQYVQLEALAKAAGRGQTVMRAHIEAQKLKPKLAMVKITVPDALRQVAGLSVTLNGLAHEQRSLGTPIPLDAGKHEIEATAPGYITEKRTVTLAEGKTATVELSMVRETWSGRRAGAYVAGGMGIAGLLLGGVTGGVVIAKLGVVENNCGAGGGFPNDPLGCNKTGFYAVSEAKKLGLMSTISFGVGAAGVATAAILLLTERKRTSAASRGFHPGVLAAAHDGAILGIWGAW